MKRGLLAILAVLAGFTVHHLLHLEPSVIALFGAALLLALIPVSGPEIIHKDIEWPTLVFFGSLFIIVGALKETGVILTIADLLTSVLMGHKFLAVIAMLWFSALASIFINPVAFTALFVHVVTEMSVSIGMESEPLFWALAMGSCFGGNGSYLGATANVVLSDIAEKSGHPLSFTYFMKVGLRVVLISLVISTIFLTLKYHDL
jgi:Na+/H+ antiporter NhaD/arsenite permease-like protein